MKKKSSISSKQDVADIHPPVTAPPESEDSTAPPDVSATAIDDSANTANRDAVTPADNDESATRKGHTSAKNGKRAKNGTKVGKTDATSTSSVTTASTNPSGEPPEERSSDVSKLQDLEAKVRDSQSGDFEAGEALKAIKEQKLYKTADADKGLTWKEYCEKRFGFSQQYANRLIKASERHMEVCRRFKDKNREEDFQHLPCSVNFWEQAARLGDNCDDALYALLDSNGARVDDWSSKWSETLAAAKNSKEPTNAGKDDEAKKLADTALQAIMANIEVSDALKAMSPRTLKVFIKELADLVKSSCQEDQDDADLN